jgi:hypothetical protein
MTGRTRNPIAGEKALVAFSSTGIVRVPATVVQYEEHPIPGSCDMTTEYLMLDIQGFGVTTLTRHSILPEAEQEWNVQDSIDMVTVEWEETNPALILREVLLDAGHKVDEASFRAAADYCEGTEG